MTDDTKEPAAIAAPAEPDEGEEPDEVTPFGLHDPETFKPGHDPLRALDERLGSSLDEEEAKADLLYGIASHRPRAFR